MKWLDRHGLTTFEGMLCSRSMRLRRAFVWLGMAFPIACSSPTASSGNPTTTTEQPGAEDKYDAPTTISGPGLSVGSGEVVDACSMHDARLGVDISGALQLSADTDGYGCSGTRTLEGDQLNPSVTAILGDGRALDIGLFIEDSELDQIDAPTTVKIWAHERPLTFGAYSESWRGEACSTSYQIEPLEVSSNSRKTYRVQGSTSCASPLVGDDLGHTPSDPTATLERFEFVGFVAWFDRSLL
jgi:hypothetical protein